MRKKPVRRLSFVFTFFAFSANAAWPQISEQFKQDLHGLENNIFAVRNFYHGEKIKFSQDGSAINGQRGIWTVDGFILLKKTAVSDGKLRLDGVRLAAVYDRKQQNMRLVRYETPVAIEVPIKNDADASAKIRKIFIQSAENIVELLPPEWRCFAETHEIRDVSFHALPSSTKCGPDESNASRVRKDVIAPSVTSAKEPRFSRFARQFQITGSTAIALVVGIDGVPRDFVIVRPRVPG